MSGEILSREVLNERLNAYYSSFLSRYGIRTMPSDPFDKPENYIAYIKKHREDIAGTRTALELNELIGNMIIRSKRELIATERISWIGSSERACLFTWYQLMIFIRENQNSVLQKLYSKNKLVIRDDYLQTQCFPSDSRAQIIQTLKIIDLLSDEELIHIWLERVKSEWIKAFKSRSPFSYLRPENSDDCIWTWQYLKDRNIACGELIDFPDSADIYHAIFLSFDVWITRLMTSDEDVKTFRQTFNKKKASRKYKKSQEENINIQFYLDVNTREKLRALSRSRRLNNGEMLKELILEEYQRYKKVKF
ncbi:TPA: hypothetical protein P7Q55_003510 [Escherichia coli]|nr:hypothetical protein [Escherichia coli]